MWLFDVDRLLADDLELADRDDFVLTFDLDDFADLEDDRVERDECAVLLECLPFP